MGKFCGKCGKEISVSNSFCTNCGAKYDSEVDTNYKEESHADEPVVTNNGYADAGLVLSFFVSGLGLIFSIIGLSKANQYGGIGRSIARAGLIISIAGLIIKFVIFFPYIENALKLIDF